MKVIQALARHLVDLDLLAAPWGSVTPDDAVRFKDAFSAGREPEAERAFRAFGLMTGVSVMAIGGIWRHVKTGGEYQVIGACRIEATNTPAFLYRSIETGKVWCRPKAEFLDGRFECVPDVDSGGSK